MNPEDAASIRATGVLGVIAEAKTENLMASTWTKAAIVRRTFKAGPRRKSDLVYGAEHGFLECRILYIELRNAMLEAGIKTGASDVSVGLILMTPWTAKGRAVVHVLHAGGSIDDFTKSARKVEQLEKQHKAIPIGVAFWQRDHESGQDETWVRAWRLDNASAEALAHVSKELKQEKGNSFEREL